jgi:hypothetical protein
MKMYEEAKGFLFIMVPIVMRINIFIVDPNENKDARNSLANIFQIQDGKASRKDMKL